MIDTYGKRLIELCQSASIVIGNGRLHSDLDIGDYTFHSRNGSSVVDYLLLNADDMQYISDFKILDPNEFSDHSGIAFNMIGKSIHQQNISEHENYITFIKWDDKKINDFQQLLHTKNDELLKLIENVNQWDINNLTNAFTNVLQECTDTIFKQTRTNNNEPSRKHRAYNPWFNADCYNARKEFKRTRNIFLRNKNDENRQHYISAKTQYSRIKRTHKNRFNVEEKRNLTNLSKYKPKQFWKKIKNQYKKNDIKPSNLNLTDTFNHFKNLYGTENLNNDTNDDILHGIIHDEDLDRNINITELRSAVFQQNNNKSSGIDTLIAEVYKHSFDVIAPFLLPLFNRLIQTGEYPKSWGTGIIVPIYKSGDVNNVQNDRGITLINIIAKIYSQVILNRLKNWSIKHEKIIENQFGFQKGKSTTDYICFSFYYCQNT